MNDRYKEEEVIYFVQSVRITKSTDLVTNKLVCVKTITVEDFNDLTYLFKEIIALFTLNKKVHFVKILDYWLDGYQREVTYLNIVTEYFEKGDLSREILDRSKKARPFTLDVLKGHFKQLLGGFKELQEINFSHRDIKAENIFIDSNNQLVIGDLGSAAQKSEEEMTLIGSHIYMSPEIRASFDKFNRGENGPRVNYNPVKSDVWSLGITFLYMITLEKPVSLTNLVNITDKINTELNKVKDVLFRNLLVKMLRKDPNERDDFNALYDWFVNEIEPDLNFNRRSLSGSQIIKTKSNGISNENLNPFDDDNLVCEVCFTKDNMIKCNNCSFLAHTDCLEGNFITCKKCGKNLDWEESTFKCKKCNKRFEGKEISNKCKHLLCFQCQGSQSDCHNCTGFILNSKKPESFKKLSVLMCPECQTTMHLKDRTLTCQLHKNYKLCIVCKLPEHRGNCLNANSSETIYCLKCGVYTSRIPNTFIINCHNCANHYCYICLEDINTKSHLECSNMFTWE